MPGNCPDRQTDMHVTLIYKIAMTSCHNTLLTSSAPNSGCREVYITIQLPRWSVRQPWNLFDNTTTISARIIISGTGYESLLPHRSVRQPVWVQVELLGQSKKLTDYKCTCCVQLLRQKPFDTWSFLSYSNFWQAGSPCWLALTFSSI